MKRASEDFWSRYEATFIPYVTSPKANTFAIACGLSQLSQRKEFKLDKTLIHKISKNARNYKIDEICLLIEAFERLISPDDEAFLRV